RKPHGLAMYCPPDTVEPSTDACRLYIAEEHQVVRYMLDPATGAAIRGEKIIDLPAGGRHTSRTLMFLDERLLISIGSSCDVCVESNPWRGSIIAVDPDGGNPEIFASGLRNAVFMARHPVDGSVWATEMGRDHLGDNLPPDEINLVEKGKSYGWPLCYGQNIHDAEFDKNTYIRNPCMSPFETPSRIDLPAHSAPLGIAFFPEEGWPEEYWYNALVAYHGSWNRTEPTGYKIARYRLDASGMPLKGATRLTSQPVPPEDDFITGWLTDEGALGRPVDILIESGGTLYVSDDKAGVIYRITYNQN
ncbi:MAG: PQQ-dependent sugar dehydrogenase, partial [Patescibacteria group bacterium]